MNSRWLNKLRFTALAACVALVLSGSVLVAQQAAPSGSRTDGQIEMDVVHALDASAALKNDLITAATIQGEVTLSGTVASDADRQLAESISAKVPGVTKVNNKLQVGNPADDPNNVGGPDAAAAAQPAPDDQQAANVAKRYVAMVPRFVVYTSTIRSSALAYSTRACPAWTTASSQQFSRSARITPEIHHMAG